MTLFASSFLLDSGGDRNSQVAASINSVVVGGLYNNSQADVFINDNSQFSFDSMSRCVKITETSSGAVSSTKQFIWCGTDRCEVRDGSGNLLNQYFSLGQVNVSGGTATNYYFTKDHLGSVREMTNSSGAIQSQFSYDPW